MCVWKEKKAIDPSQTRKRKTEHRQLLSKSKQRSISYKPTTTKKQTHHIQYIPHTHTHYTYVDQCGMRKKEKKTTDKHTEANYNSRMKEMYNTRSEREKKKHELVHGISTS